MSNFSIDRKMDPLWLMLVFILELLGTTWAQNFYVVTPAKLRLNAEARIAVAAEGIQGVMNVYIQDHPQRLKNITHITLAMVPGEVTIFTVYLDPADFPPNFLKGSDSPKPVRVSVTAVIEEFRKEILVPITTQSGYVFIQTDKPIYTPNQRAFIRIISLNEEVASSDEPIKLQIVNPDGDVVEERLYTKNNARSGKAFDSYAYKFPTYPLLGTWAATVHYGYDFQQETTVNFDLQEYVLPIFTIEVQTPNFILPSTDIIEIKVLARYVYGKPVQGIVTFQIGLRRGDGSNIIFFAFLGSKELDQGSYELRIQTDHLKQHKDIGWFPAIEGSHLVVETTVVDDATGNREKSTHINTMFTKCPFLISFKRCLTEFKPGYNSIFEADVTYVDGTPAAGILTKIRAMADGKPLSILQDSAVTDDEGKVSFEIHTELQHSSISVTLETNDAQYDGSQAFGSFVQNKYQSMSKAYLLLAREPTKRLQPGDMFSKVIYYESSGFQNVFYMILSRGNIIDVQSLPSGSFKQQSIRFEITHKMVPSFRLVVFTHYRNEFIADSLKFDVKKVCDPKAEVFVQNVFHVIEPGNPGKIHIQGNPGNWVGLLEVDESLYALSKKDILTKAKMFDTFDSHDLGCGPGGGVTTNHVFENAGIIIGTNLYTETLVGINGTFFENICDKVQFARKKQISRERKNFGLKKLEEHNNSSKRLERFSRRKTTTKRQICQHGCDEPDDLEFIPPEAEDAFEKETLIRQDFRETFLFEDLRIGPESHREIAVSLPHSITTWVMSTISVSPQSGMCITEPQKLISFKQVFLHLNLLYSVARNEQVEVQATVFNHRDTVLPALVYIYGENDLCSNTITGKKSERNRLLIKPNSAQSVSFPVIPLKVQIFKIKVVLLTVYGTDIVEKDLRVVPEGYTREESISIKLDPTNKQRRPVSSFIISDSVDPIQNLQKTAVKLILSEDFVTGSDSSSVAVIGQKKSPTVFASSERLDILPKNPITVNYEHMVTLAYKLCEFSFVNTIEDLNKKAEEIVTEHIVRGCNHELSFKNRFSTGGPSTWLTAFVMKVFCQVNELVHFDNNEMCTDAERLMSKQGEDGSFVERNHILDRFRVFGEEKTVLMTAFVLITLEECECMGENLTESRGRAVAYLGSNFENLSEPFPLAIVAYALALSNNALKEAANDKLMKMAKMNKDGNLMYWETQNSAQDIETAGYALLTQLLFNDMKSSSAIVNWINTKPLHSGSYVSTQDTVIALQSLSAYAKQVQQFQMSVISLVVNISSSSDPNFRRTLTFYEENAYVRQEVKLNKAESSTIFINTTGHGVGKLTLKYRYNLIEPQERACKFYFDIHVSESEHEDDEENETTSAKTELETSTGITVKRQDEVQSNEWEDEVSSNEWEDEVRSNEFKLIISICVKYLGQEELEFTVVDVGIFSGFEPDVTKLNELEEDPNHLIQRYEMSSRGVVFYLQKVPTDENYSFSFPIIRNYISGNRQISVISVYDYYNPDKTCRKFYSTGEYSFMLRTICEDSLCECVEDGCPSNRVLMETSESDSAERQTQIINIICDNYDYAWTGNLTSPPKKAGGFWIITFLIEKVITEGIEKRIDIIGESRILLSRDYCKEILPGQRYLIMGKDGMKYENREGVAQYRYLLDQRTVLHLMSTSREAKDPLLQRILNRVEKIMVREGCQT